MCILQLGCGFEFFVWLNKFDFLLKWKQEIVDKLTVCGLED